MFSVAGGQGNMMIFFTQRIYGCAPVLYKLNYQTSRTFKYSTRTRAAVAAVKKRTLFEHATSRQ